MAKRKAADRSNQRHRTRKELLAAAARLMKQGGAPDMDEIAAEAMVSRATAYRYFPSMESLLVEAPLDGLIPRVEDVFPASDTSTDPVERAARAEAALHQASYRNESQLRLMLAASLERVAIERPHDDVPVRQNRRTPLIEAALAPARRKMSKATHARLCAALAVFCGPESMIVFQDVLGIDERAAQKVKTWAVRELVTAALRES